MFGRNVLFHPVIYLLPFFLRNVVLHTRLNHTRPHVKSINVIIPCVHCTPLQKKTDAHQKVLDNDYSLSFFSV